MSEIFDVNRPAIVKHIQNIYKTGELKEKSTCSKMEHIASDWKKRIMHFYNLDTIISVWYRVNSKNATNFRIWATSVVKDYLIQWYALSQKRLSETGLKTFEKSLVFSKKISIMFLVDIYLYTFKKWNTKNSIKHLEKEWLYLWTK